MRNKSGNLLEETAEIAPLVRGARTKKEKGELAELAFLHKAASLGFGVAKPYGDSECYDFILDTGKRFWRVQVKSSYVASRRAYRGMAQRTNRQRYRAGDIDFLVAYVVPRDIRYVVPVKCFSTSAAMGFYPSGCRKNAGRFECYREAWYLMAPGAGLPRPGTLRRIRAIAVHRK
jgi:PD-(D/E)XK endonuclease